MKCFYLFSCVVTLGEGCWQWQQIYATHLFITTVDQIVRDSLAVVGQSVWGNWLKIEVMQQTTGSCKQRAKYPFLSCLRVYETSQVAQSDNSKIMTNYIFLIYNWLFLWNLQTQTNQIHNPTTSKHLWPSCDLHFQYIIKLGVKRQSQKNV